MESYQQEIEQSKDELLDIKARSMRENLMFYGIPESTAGQTENCEQLVKELIRLKLQLDTEHIQFDRSHRLGPKTASKTRPIVVKFQNYQTRETVRQKSLQPEIKTDLKNCGRGISVQTPVEYRDASHSRRMRRITVKQRVSPETNYILTGP